MTAAAGFGRTVRLLLLGPLFYLPRAPWLGLLLLFLVALLTLLTQIGGVVLWLWLAVSDVLRRAAPDRLIGRRLAAVALFVPFYLGVSLLLVPPVAGAFGRVPLACWSDRESAYGPLTRAICLTNRHYAAPTARAALDATAARLAAVAPGRRLVYLDAGFPFHAWFPMLPHLSHGDGRKIDVALLFVDPGSRRPLPGRARSPIGYGGYVPPAPGAALPCSGIRSWRRWDFDWLQPLLPDLDLDVVALRGLFAALVASPRVARVFIEPHIGARLGMRHDKIRFQGCGAARHDDHIHIEFR